jgi:hypothetical protein
MYLCEKTGQFLPADPVARVTDVPADGRRRRRLRPDQSEHLLSRRADAGKVPDSAIKFYEDRFVNL